MKKTSVPYIKSDFHDLFRNAVERRERVLSVAWHRFAAHIGRIQELRKQVFREVLAAKDLESRGAYTMKLIRGKKSPEELLEWLSARP